jgi:hypothetical protein
MAVMPLSFVVPLNGLPSSSGSGMKSVYNANGAASTLSIDAVSTPRRMRGMF